MFFCFKWDKKSLIIFFQRKFGNIVLWCNRVTSACCCFYMSWMSSVWPCGVAVSPSHSLLLITCQQLRWNLKLWLKLQSIYFVVFRLWTTVTERSEFKKWYWMAIRTQMLVRIWRKENPLYMIDGNVNWWATMKNSMGISQKTKNRTIMLLLLLLLCRFSRVWLCATP